MSDGSAGAPWRKRAAPPSRSLLAWIEGRCSARVTGTRRLQGGISTPVHAVSLARSGTVLAPVVVRHWTGLDHDEGRKDVAVEAGVLDQLGPTPVPSPTLLGVSDGAATDGVPAVLMSRLPGRVHLAPADLSSWLHQMASTLAEIHQVQADAVAHPPGRRPAPDEPPAWSTRPALWRAALDVLQDDPPPTPEVFLHGDYQHFNLLWSRGRLSGVVDWTQPRRGAPAADAAHCILNLTILFGHETAGRFRVAYEQASGHVVEPWWELHRLTMYGPAWQRFIPVQVAGQVPVDVSGMTDRVEAGLEDALRRLGSTR